MLRYPLDQTDHDLFYIRTFDAGQEAAWNSLKLPVPPIRPDLDGIRQAQAAKTPDQQRRIEEETMASGVVQRFSVGKEDGRAIQAANDYIVPFAHRAKMLYARARPDQLGIIPSIATPLHASYPSGHAMQAYAYRDVMTCLYPEKEQQYAQIAEDIAYNRVRAGVHYPSDSIVSAELVRQIRCPMLQRLAEQGQVPERCLCAE